MRSNSLSINDRKLKFVLQKFLFQRVQQKIISLINTYLSQIDKITPTRSTFNGIIFQHGEVM